MTKLVSQPSAAPTRKLTFALVWGGLTAAALTFADLFYPEISESLPVFLTALEPLVSIGVGIAAGYFAKERAA